ncbi:hypothetical protein HYALB_00008894 [Hymenoscyphus albidus]|uniref:Uncharacterized protein n=1 Tax=Hymenoscyphus albidus TaxID=595503 RepID=A0A9N9LXI6_9HELO|nr:hypothetical protein HYALB_00008894 [Hymenoscyphus albidus]
MDSGTMQVRKSGYLSTSHSPEWTRRIQTTNVTSAVQNVLQKPHVSRGNNFHVELMNLMLSDGLTTRHRRLDRVRVDG